MTLLCIAFGIAQSQRISFATWTVDLWLKTLFGHYMSGKQIICDGFFMYYRITCLSLQFLCKWLYIGTDRGNVHVVNIDTFQLSGYVINWNKAIEM